MVVVLKQYVYILKIKYYLLIQDKIEKLQLPSNTCSSCGAIG